MGAFVAAAHQLRCMPVMVCGFCPNAILILPSMLALLAANQPPCCRTAPTNPAPTHMYPLLTPPTPSPPPPLLQQTHTCTTQVSADRLLDKELLSPGGGMGRAIPLHTKGEVGAPLNARGHAAHDDHDHQGSTTASSSTTTGSTTTSSTVSSSQKEGAKQREEADAQVAASRRRSAAKKR